MQKTIIRIFLILFIAAIFAWIIPSTIGFMELSPERAHELPQWLKDMTPSARGWFLTFSFQLTYYLIVLGLLIEFFFPRITLKWNRNKFLTAMAVILIINGLLAVIFGGILKGFPGGLYDTMFYGLGLGILFLLQIDARSPGLQLLLWTRLIEIWGPVIGYTVIPAAMGNYTGGAFGHYGYGLAGMVASPWFWNDFIGQFISVIAVMYILRQSGRSSFWIWSFSIGAIIVGLALARILPMLF